MGDLKKMLWDYLYQNTFFYSILEQEEAASP